MRREEPPLNARRRPPASRLVLPSRTKVWLLFSLRDRSGSAVRRTVQTRYILASLLRRHQNSRAFLLELVRPSSRFVREIIRGMHSLSFYWRVRRYSFTRPPDELSSKEIDSWVKFFYRLWWLLFVRLFQKADLQRKRRRWEGIESC